MGSEKERRENHGPAMRGGSFFQALSGQGFGMQREVNCHYEAERLRELHELYIAGTDRRCAQIRNATSELFSGSPQWIRLHQGPYRDRLQHFLRVRDTDRIEISPAIMFQRNISSEHDLPIQDVWISVRNCAGEGEVFFLMTPNNSPDLFPEAFHKCMEGISNGDVHLLSTKGKIRSEARQFTGDKKHFRKVLRALAVRYGKKNGTTLRVNMSDIIADLLDNEPHSVGLPELVLSQLHYHASDLLQDEQDEYSCCDIRLVNDFSLSDGAEKRHEIRRKASRGGGYIANAFGHGPPKRTVRPLWSEDWDPKEDRFVYD